MCIEIEAKIKVDDLAVIADTLRTVGARPGDRVVHIDTFYDHPAPLVIQKGAALRLRRRIIGNDQTVILTHKGPRQKGRFKNRQEIEFQTDDLSATVIMLGQLGFRKKLVIEKRRAFWKLDNCAICLDELPLLGTFVEVEGPDENAVAAVLEKIGLDAGRHIDTGYAGLMKKMLEQTDPDRTEVLFEDN
jgi:adenylate cyclase class 2